MEGVGGVFDHACQQQRAAVLEDHGGLEVGLDPYETMTIEFEVLDHGHVVNHQVVDGMYI